MFKVLKKRMIFYFDKLDKKDPKVIIAIGIFFMILGSFLLMIV